MQQQNEGLADLFSQDPDLCEMSILKTSSPPSATVSLQSYAFAYPVRGHVMSSLEYDLETACIRPREQLVATLPQLTINPLISLTGFCV